MLIGCSDLMEMSDSMQIYPNLPNQLIAICTGSGNTIDQYWVIFIWFIKVNNLLVPLSIMSSVLFGILLYWYSVCYDLLSTRRSNSLFVYQNILI